MSTTLVVMQPTVLPWAGYFNLMHLADDFVFHDDIQLEKRSWQTRNRLLLEGKADWISLPIEHISEKQRISETRVLVDKKWIAKFLRCFRRNYEKHSYFKEAFEVVDYFVNLESDNLAIRNEEMIRFIAEHLQIIGFCKHFQASIYLSPLGSSEYLQADSFSARSPSHLTFQNYGVLPYPQINSKDFVPNLSILDVIANLGLEHARSYIIGPSTN